MVDERHASMWIPAGRIRVVLPFIALDHSQPSCQPTPLHRPSEAPCGPARRVNSISMWLKEDIIGVTLVTVSAAVPSIGERFMEKVPRRCHQRYGACNRSRLWTGMGPGRDHVVRQLGYEREHLFEVPRRGPAEPTACSENSLLFTRDPAPGWAFLGEKLIAALSRLRFCFCRYSAT